MMPACSGMEEYKAYRLGQVEEKIYELDLDDTADDLLELDDGNQMVISGWWVHIPELGLNLHEGVFCLYDESEKEYLPDFSVTVIKESGQEEWIYYEQDGFVVTLANWLKGSVELNRLEQMRCYISKPEKE